MLIGLPIDTSGMRDHCYSSSRVNVNHSAKCKVWRASRDVDVKNHDLGTQGDRSIVQRTRNCR